MTPDVYMQQLPCYHIWLFLLAVPLSPQTLLLFTIQHQLIIKLLFQCQCRLSCLPLALAQMCGCLRITCKHLYCCDCYRAAELCLNIHSATAILGKMFNCLLTRRANHMAAIRYVWAWRHVEDVLEFNVSITRGLYMIVGAGLNISPTADLIGFSHTTISRI